MKREKEDGLGIKGGIRRLREREREEKGGGEGEGGVREENRVPTFWADPIGGKGTRVIVRPYGEPKGE